MTENSARSRGAENRWPLSLDTRDPEAVADFLIGLGYSEDAVVNALVQRCSLDRITARAYVRDVVSKTPQPPTTGGHS